MLPYTLLPPARRYLKKVVDKHLRKKFTEAVYAICEDPTAGEAKKGDLVGIWGYDVYHQGANYELAYRLAENDQGELIVIIMAGTRENFYEELKRYMNN